MFRYLVPVLAASAAFGSPPTYEVSGRFTPKARASVVLYGVTTPFAASTFLFPGGVFHFKKLPPGGYTLAIFMRSRGEARQTIEVGPGTADRRRRISLDLHLKDSDFVLASALRRHLVSAKELAIPEKVLRLYRDALKDLSRQDVASASRRLEEAVERAPQFSAAWNNLGTIAYQAEKFDRAEECFRQAHEQDPESYEALVNLGGVLVTLRKLDEALDYNAQAVLARPNDALGQSQLGMSYFLVGNLDLAKKHLEIARSLDPAHFSYPQLILFEIALRQGDRHGAADVLEDFLVHHPDWPRADAAKKTIADLRSR